MPFYKKVVLPSVLAGHVILSAGKDGVVAVSSLADGATTRLIEDHRGAAVTAIHCVNEQVSPAIEKESPKNASSHLQVMQRSFPRTPSYSYFFIIPS